ncbi:site-2 protease family protein [Novipirellula artificiosorum]|uniref:Peptidase family M50 n=1 Tax=Novipirellula artificiosorum TaxID=2528016 RepID=A0A5C6E050_9BACT|nr:site-2 protease family protein [Novipirellula artificiosorum]TWU40696.1 Peptidase family M50 [Novipirellula artificiosorum]
MLLQEPAESPYDLRFELFGFPIRIAWTFWLGAAIFGYSLVDLVDYAFQDASPGRAPLLLLWALCLLVSILIHELGHALAFRQCGVHSAIVLYHFGGLAVPIGSTGTTRPFSRLTEKENLWIALAGPLAQLASAFVLVGIVKGSGYRVAAFELMPVGLDRFPGVLDGKPIESAGLFSLVTFYVWPSVVWALLNLVPVWPLDGGRISNSLVLIFGGRREQALWVSVLAAGLLAVYGFKNGQMFMAILFFSLAYSNFQMLQQNGTWRY